jgi:gliding motility-associated-like protein
MNTLRRLISSIALVATSLATTAQDYSNIEFVENKGQWDPRIKYKGDVNAGSVFITDKGFTILQHNAEDYAALQEALHQFNSKSAESLRKQYGKTTIRSHAIAVEFIGASPKMKVVADKPVDSYNNYFTGDDPSKWASSCRIYQAITLQDVYPNVDVRYYTNNGTLKYDIIAKPGADISKIALKYKGADKMSVQNKELVVSTSIGDLKESYPYTYQPSKTGRLAVKTKYFVKDDVVRFDVDKYDKSSTLVIDPSFRWCSLSGSGANNWGFTATYGPDGSFYGGGIIFEGTGYPVSTGAFQTQFQGGYSPVPVDIGIIKLTADGARRSYATYIGGAGSEQPHSLIVDPGGNLIIAGRSNSPVTGNGAYPVTGGTAGIVGKCGGYDIIVTELNAGATGLIGSKRIGGTGDDGVNIKEGRGGSSSLEQNYGDDGRSEVILDNGGNIYVASCSQSPGTAANPDDIFPTTAGAYKRTFGGGKQDAVVLKFAPNVGNVLFATFLGGSGNDAGYVLSLGPGGDIYVGGGTESSNFVDPSLSAGTIGPVFRGGIDGYVARFSNDGSTLIKATYLGTPDIDQVFGLKFDNLGFPYVTGQTRGAWPVQPAGIYSSGGKQFIAKMQPDLSAYIYSTVFGNGSSLPNISITAFLVDRCENVYVSGWGGSINPDNPTEYASGGTAGLPLTADALPYPPGGPDGQDFYFFVLRKDATGQLFGSYFGQNGGFTDHVDGGTSRFDANGVIYQAMCANCGGLGNFPASPGAYARVKPASAYCNLGMVKIAFNLAGVGADVESAIDGVPRDTAGCVPLLVTFTDQIRNATEYIWNYGDGTGDFGPMRADTGYTQQHWFTSVGTFRVRLIAIDPASCNVRDTTYINIRVGDLRAALAASYEKTGLCTALDYRFINLTPQVTARPFTDTSFAWDFGDGSPLVIAGLNDVIHTYPAKGTYNAKLILRDTAYCNYPDTLPLRVSVFPNVDAIIETPARGCAPYTVTFGNASEGGATWEWDFGDPASGANNTSTAFEPTHTFETPGPYTIRLIARDPNTCNKVDTDYLNIQVFDKPIARYSYTPITPIVNTPNIFTNESSDNAVRFKWLWDDGDSLVTTSRAPVTYQFNETRTFNVCLIAYNEVGCTDTFCLPVSAIIDPLVDVPNAFTPNTGDVNSVIKVRGFGIAKMRWIIWNRWGKKVFETANRNEGWNGKVNGTVQPMDVYAYTLDIEFFDGKRATKKGDITLIR